MRIVGFGLRVGPTLEDEALVSSPFASAVVELHSGRDYGCRADVSLITLSRRIYCDVLEIDESASAIGFDANGSVQRQRPSPRRLGMVHSAS